MKGRRQRAERNKERRRSRRGRRQQEERLPQGVAAEIGASADLAIAVGEAGDGHAVDERDVKGDGDGAAEATYRSGDAALPERAVNGDDAAAFEPRRRDVRARPGAKPFQPQREGRARYRMRSASWTEDSGPGLPDWFRFHLLDDVGDADHRFAKRRQRGLVSRIDVDTGGAGLDSVIRVTQRVALVSVEAVSGRARLDPWRTVRVGDGPSSFQAGKTGKP